MSPKRILIIDDETSFTEMVKINLEATRHYEVCTENYSPKAVETARKFRPDLILLDFIMPDMDGGDVAAALKQDPLLKSIPIVFVTAIVSNREIGSDGTCVSGGQLMLAKPVSLTNLVRCIQDKLP
jgi:CheY-like chemotaxis protein